jgi:hypothetical protein
MKTLKIWGKNRDPGVCSCRHIKRLAWSEACTLYGRCSGVNSTQSPALGAGNFSEPRIMSQVERVRVDQRISAVRAVEVPVLVCLRSSCSHVSGVGGP